MKTVPHGSIGRWRVGSGQEVLISRGSGRVGWVMSFLNLAGRVGSGRVKKVSKSRGLGRVKSTHLKIFAGRVGVGSGQLTLPDPTREV